MTSNTACAMAIAAVERAVAGDETAFARIVAAHHADLVRVAYGITGDRDLALDAVQYSWIIAWRKLHTLRDRDRLRAWLVSVAANEARHLARRRRPVHVAELELDRRPRSDGDPADDIPRVDLVNAVWRLGADERAVIALRYGAGYDSDEIAPLLHLSPSGVRSRLARSLARLRKDLAHG
jgi:RNA polymerase sigma-70 factor (ECF subfamily)